MSLATATRSEVTKQFTTVGWWVIGIIMVGYLLFQAGVVTAAMGYSAQQSNVTEVGTDTTGVLYGIAATSGYIFPLLFGTLMVTTEFRHALIVPTFLATPKRGTALVAKFLTGILMGALFAAIAVAVTVGLVIAGLSIFGVDNEIGAPETWATLARAFLALVIWSLIGIGVGSVIRNQVAAIVVVLAFTLLIEPVVRFAAMFVTELQDYAQWLPAAATDALVGYSLLNPSMGMGTGGTELLPWWVGALVLAGYAIVLTTIGALTTWRRDVS